MRAGLLAVLALAAFAGTARAEGPGEVGLRSGEHPGFGRIVLDLPPGLEARATQDGADVTVRFNAPATVATGARPPRNVRSITAAPAQVQMQLALLPGSRMRVSRLGNRMVLDLLDPDAKPRDPANLVAPASAAPVAAGSESVPPGPTKPTRVKNEPVASRSGKAPASQLAIRSAPVGLQPIDRHPDDAAQDTVAGGPAALPQPVKAVGPMPPPPAAASVIEIPVAAAGVSAGPMQLAASLAPLPPGRVGRAITLPFEPGVGAAAFRRGSAAIVVFDRRRPIDMAALRGDPVFASATVQMLPAATTLQIPLPGEDVLQLLRTAAGWIVAVVPEATPGPARDIAPLLVEGALQLPTPGAGSVVSIPDPGTGGVLLVGTLREGGRAVAVARRTPEFALLQTWQGIAVEPVSDAVVVRVMVAAASSGIAAKTDAEPKQISEAKPPAEGKAEGEAKSETAKPAAAKPVEAKPAMLPSGFIIEAGSGRGLALDAPSMDAILDANAGYLTRRFDFPLAATETLRLRQNAAVRIAAAAPAQARTGKRLIAAQAMLAMGMAPEAQSVLSLAATADGRGVNNPDLAGLSGIAALLAGRPAEAAGIDDARLSGTDEVALWRAVRTAMAKEVNAETSPAAAAVFAANLPLLLAYPDALRDRLLPLAAETMARGGAQVAAQALLDARPDDRRLDLARAMLLERNEPEAALAAYDHVAQDADRLVRARAAGRAVELRLASGALSPAQAANALDRLIYSWRGDGRELALRRRVAELRVQAGEFRPALALLRETETIWPEQRAALRTEMATIFTDAVVRDGAKPLPPLDLVALAEENADLFPEGSAGQELVARLVDRLVALDLPRRAVPLLEKLAAQAPAGPVRAAFGGRVAAMRLEQGDAAAALAALGGSAADDLPAELQESRVLTFARACAALGQTARSGAALAALGTPPALSLRADLLEAAKDWPAATAALGEVAARELPPAGELNEPQGRLLLRLASAAAQANDKATLAAVREHDLPRLTDPRTAELVRLLTSGPVQGVADLPRSAAETKLARAVPAALRTMTR